MSEQETINWFWNKFKSCYTVQHIDYPNNIFMLYDENFVRQIKLSKLSGKENKIPNKIKGVCLFEIDFENNNFWYNYSDIYSFLYDNYLSNWGVINQFIHTRLSEIDKLNMLFPNLDNQIRIEKWRNLSTNSLKFSKILFF